MAIRTVFETALSPDDVMNRLRAEIRPRHAHYALLLKDSDAATRVLLGSVKRDRFTCYSLSAWGRLPFVKLIGRVLPSTCGSRITVWVIPRPVVIPFLALYLFAFVMAALSRPGWSFVWFQLLLATVAFVMSYTQGKRTEALLRRVLIG